MKQRFKHVTALVLTALAALSLARVAPAAGLASEAIARLLAQVEPRLKAIYEASALSVNGFYPLLPIQGPAPDFAAMAPAMAAPSAAAAPIPAPADALAPARASRRAAGRGRPGRSTGQPS